MALTDNLVSYYKLDGNSNDSVGSNNGTDTSVTYGSSYGKINSGVAGGLGKIDLGTSDTLNLTSGFSVNFWTKLDNTSSNAYLASRWKYTGGNYRQWTFLVNQTGNYYIDFWTTRNGDGTGSTQVELKYDCTAYANTWVMVTGTWDGSNQRLYINGSLVDGPDAQASIFNATGQHTYIGVGDSGSTLPSVVPLDEFGFWSRALSDSEITSLYNSGSGSQYPFTPPPDPNTIDFSSTPRQALKILDF